MNMSRYRYSVTVTHRRPPLANDTESLPILTITCVTSVTSVTLIFFVKLNILGNVGPKTLTIKNIITFF